MAIEVEICEVSDNVIVMVDIASSNDICSLRFDSSETASVVGIRETAITSPTTTATV